MKKTIQVTIQYDDSDRAAIGYLSEFLQTGVNLVGEGLYRFDAVVLDDSEEEYE